MHGYVVQWDFTVNSSILEVQNYRDLQIPREPEVVANLKWWMNNHQFDMAFFMNPHFNPKDADCWNACREKQHAWDAGKLDEEPPNCNDVCADGRAAGARGDVDPLWDVIYEAMQGKVYQVEEWGEGGLQADWYHAKPEYAIQTYDILKGHFCNVDDECAQPKTSKGHQCQPGNLIQVSERLVAKMS